MVKDSLCDVKESLEDIRGLASQWWPDEEVASFQLLKGGYSATNYRISTASGKSAVLKICKGYTLDDADKQAQLADYLAVHGFEKCSHPYRLAAPSSPTGHTFVTAFGSWPVMMVNYLDGKGGDVLVEAGVMTLEQASARIGKSLAGMHKIPFDPETSSLRSYLTDGICFLGRHLGGEYVSLYTTHPETSIREHEYVSFYLDRVESACAAIQACASMRVCVLHGDAFLDNVLFESSRGELLGFVDFEDACVGPALLDLACCIAGNCFDEANRFAPTAMQEMVVSYYSEFSDPAIMQQEQALLPSVIRAIILVNASWRFTHFNITLPEYRETHGNKYLELKQRLLFLESAEGQVMVESVLAMLKRTGSSGQTTTSS